MKIKLVAVLVGSFVFSNAWADMFCPNNFNSINIGDPIASVIAACGNPDSQTSNKQKVPQPQEWSYYIAQNPQQPGTMKLTVAFDENSKAINISVNGSGMPTTSMCTNGPISLGDTTETVKAACGTPSYVNQTNPPTGPEPETEITDLVYNGTPSVTLEFVNGKLTERK